MTPADTTLDIVWKRDVKHDPSTVINKIVSVANSYAYSLAFELGHGFVKCNVWTCLVF